MVVVTDVNEDRLARAEALFPPAEVKEKDGIDLHFVNTGKMENPAAELREMTGGTGFDDVFCYAPVAAVVELCSAVLGRDCLNLAGQRFRAAFMKKRCGNSGYDRVAPVCCWNGGYISGLDAAAETTLKVRYSKGSYAAICGGMRGLSVYCTQRPRKAK